MKPEPPRDFVKHLPYSAPDSGRLDNRVQAYGFLPPDLLAAPMKTNRNIEICQRVMPGNDVLISSVESGLAEASRPR